MHFFINCKLVARSKTKHQEGFCFDLQGLMLYSGCMFSIARLVEFARKHPDVEGVADVTWAYYSTSLVR